MTENVNVVNGIMQKLEEHRARDRDDWEGSLAEYLEKVKDDPSIVKLSHARIFDVLTKPGSRPVLETDDEKTKLLFEGDRATRVYPFFENDFFGIESAIGHIVNYFRSASQGGEESRQVLYLLGPVGAGKSTLVIKVQKGLEQETFYAIKDCPMREEPLHLIPRKERENAEKLLNLGQKIEGDLCPVCQAKLKNANEDLKVFRVEKKRFSIRSSVGIGVVPPVDPNNQDESVISEKEPIYLNPKDIKTDENFETEAKGSNTLWAFAFFCVTLVLLFVLKKINDTRKNGIR